MGFIRLKKRDIEDFLAPSNLAPETAGFPSREMAVATSTSCHRAVNLLTASPYVFI